MTDYFDDALSSAERARFEAHVAACPGCDAHLEQMRATIRAARATAELDARADVAALRSAFRAWAAGGRPR